MGKYSKYFIRSAFLFFFSLINEIVSFSLSVFYSTKCRDYLYVCMNVYIYIGICLGKCKIEHHKDPNTFWKPQWKYG